MSGWAARGAAGLLACGVLAWGAHALSPGERFSSSTVWIYRDGAGALAWSRDARRDDGAGAGVGGWRGLLLGQPLEFATATREDFEALPGVGEKTARKWIAARDGLSPETRDGQRPWTQRKYASLRPWVRGAAFGEVEK